MTELLPTICKTTDYPIDTPEYLKSLYACKDASDCMAVVLNENIKISNENKEQNEKLKIATNEYNKRKEEYEEKLKRWGDRSGEFSSYKDILCKTDKGDKVCNFWLNREDGNLCKFNTGDWNHEQAHTECKRIARNKGINDPDDFWAKTTYAFCDGLKITYECERNSNNVASNTLKYNQDMPIFTEKPPTETQFPQRKLIPAENINISCCSNYLNTGGDASNNIQQCSQVLSQEIQKLETTTKKTETTEINIKEETKDETNIVSYADEAALTTQDNMQTYIILGVVVGIILLLLSSSSVLFLVFKK
jgi:hypothetical protein